MKPEVADAAKTIWAVEASRTAPLHATISKSSSACASGTRGLFATLRRHVLAVEAAFKLPAGFWFGPTLRAASRSWVDHSNTLAAPGYTVLGLKLNQSLAHGIDWFIEGRNLTNKRYAATTGVVGNANGVDIAQFSPGEGRAVYVGANKAF